VHFGSALLVAALLSAPWHAITPLAALWCTVGVAGVLYTANVIRRMRRQSTYRPDVEDWLFHTLLPLGAYAALALSVFPAFSHLHEALFVVGAAALLLLFVGIHNAWDAIAYHVFVNLQR
jgi:4-amino-4-deoxy-L-arabinose transferase-like glycosyltransferase